MSSDRLGQDQTRFMPALVEERLLVLLSRAGGAVILVLVAAIWLSLLTWTVSDPSLTHATGGVVRNWMGPIGAIVSDLLLQTLGLAAVIMLLAPMFWSIEMLSGSRIWNLRTKAAFVPLSVLLLAGAFSSLPVASYWPLHHGMGGMIGDIVLRLLGSVFALVNPAQAGIAAGILFFAAGSSSLMSSIGIDWRDLRQLRLTVPRLSRGASSGSWHQNLKAEAHRLRERIQPSAENYAAEPYVPQPHPMQYAPAYAAAADPARYAHSEGASPYPHYDASAAYDDAPHDWADGRQEPSFDSGFPQHAPAPMPPWPTSHAVGPGPAPWAPAPQMPVAPFQAPPFNGYQPAYGPPASDGAYQNAGVAAGFAYAVSSQGYDEPEIADDSSHSMARRFASTPHNNEPDAQAPSRSPIKKPAFLREWRVKAKEPVYKRPSLNVLKRAAQSKAGAELSQTALRGTARLLEDVLADFGIKGEMRDVRPGPVVTLFEFEPARGTKISRIIALADDVARSMSVTSVRVAVVPGRSVIGIELPNVKREMVMLRDMLESEAYRASEAVLPIVLGKSIGGDAIVADLARMPHLLVAGTTGSGKSVGVNAMILSLLYRHAPEQCRMLMIDPKMLELSVYNGIPHLLTPVVTDPAKAVSALNWAVSEMEERYKRMSKLSVRNIDAFNARVREAQQIGKPLSRTVQTGFDRQTGAAIYESQEIDLQPMPYIVIVVDEFADLMTVAGKDIETAVQRLAQMARAAGIHLIMATQRPSVDIITGTIKANFPTRISFKVTSKIDSRTILNEQGAEQLLGSGDMLYSSGSGQVVRVHGPFVSDEEVETVAEGLRVQGEPVYVDDMFDQPPSATGQGGLPGGRPDNGDDLYDRAVALVMRDQKASTSYIQRRLAIGYNRAADLMERMEQEGLISPPSHSGKREILSSTAA